MFTAVTSTRIFCQEDCPAKPPKRENRVLLNEIRDCLGLGCRPCKRCKPLHLDYGPEWLDGLLSLVEDNVAANKPVDEKTLRKLGLTKQFLGRWFAANHQFTFDAYLRMRRLAKELGTLYLHPNSQVQADTVTPVRPAPAGPVQLAPTIGRKKLFLELFERKSVSPLSHSDSNSNSEFIFVNRIVTPLGPMVVCANSSSIVLLEFADRRMLETQICRIAKRFGLQFRTGVNGPILQLNQEMQEYFAGDRKDFEVAFNDEGTEFQNAVWRELRTIKAGQTSTYSELAVRLDKPKAIRAVGRANGDNRLSILVPCHRVVGADGSLTGYGGGLDRKQWLLDHEQKMAARR